MIQNSFQFIGRLTKEPVFTEGKEGKPNRVNFDLAIDGRDKDTVNFARIVMFGALAEVAAKNCDKGHLVAVSGRIDLDHKEKIVTEKGELEVVVPGFVADDIRFLSKPRTEKNEEA